MSLDKFLGSKVKGDILKYLLFVSEWVSMRALENKLWWSFPAIKKQVDILLECWVIFVEKSKGWWWLYISNEFKDIVEKLLIKYLMLDFEHLFTKKYKDFIYKCVYGDLFWNQIWTDLVIIYQWDVKSNLINDLKNDVDELIKKYFLKVINVTIFHKGEFERRYKLGDKFVLKLMNFI